MYHALFCGLHTSTEDTGRSYMWTTCGLFKTGWRMNSPPDADPRSVSHSLLWWLQFRGKGEANWSWSTAEGCLLHPELKRACVVTGAASIFVARSKEINQREKHDIHQHACLINVNPDTLKPRHYNTDKFKSVMFACEINTNKSSYLFYTIPE